jgi:excisionase family DNA binding protein
MVGGNIVQDSRKAEKPIKRNVDKYSNDKKPGYKGYARVKLKHEKTVRRSASEMETREDLLKRLLDPELTLGETAKILNVCKMTVRRYTNKGILPNIRTAGNQRRFKLSAVLEFIEKYGKDE